MKKYTDGLEELYNKAPIAITGPVEPGENFIQTAHNQGLRLGFIANTRGPVMYNWIPLATMQTQNGHPITLKPLSMTRLCLCHDTGQLK